MSRNICAICVTDYVVLTINDKSDSTAHRILIFFQPFKDKRILSFSASNGILRSPINL